MMITEESKQTPLKGSYDVIVIGGGVAGVAAAVAASRQGKTVCLVEREFELGGLATIGIVAIYLPLCDGKGHQLIKGLSEELLKESIKYGSGEIPSCWKNAGDISEREKNRYKVRFDPPSFAYALDRMIIDNNIKLMLGTIFSKAVLVENEIKYVILENKEGRFALEGKMFIDTSGDADLAFVAGEDTIEYNENRRTGWYYSYDEEEYKLNIVNDNLYAPVKDKSALYSGINNDDVTRFCIDSRKMVMDHANSQEKKRIVTQIATIPQLRMTRRLQGIYELDEEDESKEFKDSVGCFGDWRKAGPRFYLPFSTMIGKCKNLIVAGRCISARNSAWDIVRAIPVCALSGEVAGIASSLKIEQKLDSVRDINIDMLRERFEKENNILYFGRK